MKETNFHNVHEYVDLGLPSGTLWATCNIGSSNAIDFCGEHYVWGDVNPKDAFGSPLNANGQYIKYNDIDGKSELDIEDDAAYVQWGDQWRIPSKEQWQELIHNCTWTITERKYRTGYEVKSNINGNHIFLPADGVIINEEGVGSYDDAGGYWSRSLLVDAEGMCFLEGGRPTDPKMYAACIRFGKDDFPDIVSFAERCFGLSIRPVFIP